MIIIKILLKIVDMRTNARYIKFVLTFPQILPKLYLVLKL